jgi:hypothetical protein
VKVVIFSGLSEFISPSNEVTDSKCLFLHSAATDRAMLSDRLDSRFAVSVESDRRASAYHPPGRIVERSMDTLNLAERRKLIFRLNVRSCALPSVQKQNFDQRTFPYGPIGDCMNLWRFSWFSLRESSIMLQTIVKRSSMWTPIPSSGKRLSPD